MIHDKIIVCSGCEIPFNRKDRKEPNNLVFKYMKFRTRPNGRGQKVVNKFRSAGYFGVSKEFRRIGTSRS